MLALRFYDQRDIRLEEIPKPLPKKNEVLIKVTDAGISQTQINEFIEGPFIINTTPHPLTKKATPLIPSQEYGGLIVEVGEGVDKNLIGTQVAVLPLISCKECEFCKSGRENLCPKLAYRGLLGEDGGFCEYSCVDVNNILPVKQRELLTFVEPILVALHAVNRLEEIGKNVKDKEVLILGAGPIGISVALVLEELFGTDVVLNDILEARLKRALKCGFNVVEKENLKKYDIVIDAAGMDPVIDKPALIEAISYLKPSAPVLNIGTYFHPVSFIPSNLLIKEHSLIESFAYTSKDVDILKDFLKGFKRDLSPLIQTVSLKNIIEEGYFRAEVAKESFTRLAVRIDDA